MGILDRLKKDRQAAQRVANAGEHADKAKGFNILETVLNRMRNLVMERAVETITDNWRESK